MFILKYKSLWRHLSFITCHMDFASEYTELIHPLVEEHLVNARVQGE